MHITPQALLLLPHHQRDLGVGFQADHAVDHMHARALQLACPLDVVVFIEAGLELH